MVVSFYDALAPYYKYLFKDWDASVTWHASVLDEVIHEFGGGVGPVLDAACGIGTQSIGLAKLGYRVKACDISRVAIEQAKAEAEVYQVEIEFQVADLCHAWDIHQKQFPVLIACDNAIPHLLNDDAIFAAFSQFYQVTEPGGLCIISVRDYAQLERTAGQRQLVPRMVHTLEDRQVVLFDVWDFYDQDHYEITMYLIEDKGGADVRTRVFRGGRTYCVEIDTLTRCFKDAGFQGCRVVRERYFQPLLVAVK